MAGLLKFFNALKKQERAAPFHDSDSISNGFSHSSSSKSSLNTFAANILFVLDCCFSVSRAYSGKRALKLNAMPKEDIAIACC